MFLLHQIVPGEPFMLALVAVVALAYGVAAFGLLVALVGLLAVIDGGRDRLGYALLRGARLPSRRRWIAALAACTLAAALANVNALVMATWVVLAPGLELGDAIAGTNEPVALAIAAAASALYWVLATTGLPLVLRTWRGAIHELLAHRGVDRHA